MNSKYGQGNWILNESNLNLFINRTLVREKNMKLDDMQQTLAKWAEEQEHVSKAFASCDLTEENYTSELGQKVQLGFHPALSGDVIYVLEPGFMEYTRQGTTHGSPYAYDSQVPFIMYGKNVRPNTNFADVSITDIAPTICSYLRIGYPNACIGNPIISFLRPSNK
jgi:predicted AlkP superfamily pyrophosphatase or phosphodiesterase